MFSGHASCIAIYFGRIFIFHYPGDTHFTVSSFVYPDDMQSSCQVNTVISVLKAALALTLNMHHVWLNLCAVYCNTLETCNAALSQFPCLSKLLLLYLFFNLNNNSNASGGMNYWHLFPTHHGILTCLDAEYVPHKGPTVCVLTDFRNV